MSIMEKDILKVIKYFDIFSFYPNFDLILNFLEKKVDNRDLKKTLIKLINAKKLSYKAGLYTLGGYIRESKKLSHFAEASRDKKVKIQKQEERKEITRKKINKIKLYIQILSFFPQIKLIGLSGSAAMDNAKEEDDIDLFITSSINHLWTARLISLFFAQLFGFRRSRFEKNPGKKICLNLFFDEKNLSVPDYKKNYYIAHEILQMKPLVDKDNIYYRFLASNKWIYKLFPNAKYPLLKDNKDIMKNKKDLVMKNFIENISRIFQLWIIKKHKTIEIITSTQLWFFPDDYEKKLPDWARKKYNIK